jgi:hypothetical protein
MTPEQMEDKNNLDAMLLLEGKLKERVEELVGDQITRTVINIIGSQIREALNREKAKMMMEISVQLGRVLKSIDGENRKPLWECTPEELGVSANDFKRNEDAIRK